MNDKCFAAVPRTRLSGYALRANPTYGLAAEPIQRTARRVGRLCRTVQPRIPDQMTAPPAAR